MPEIEITENKSVKALMLERGRAEPHSQQN